MYGFDDRMYCHQQQVDKIKYHDQVIQRSVIFGYRIAVEDQARLQGMKISITEISIGAAVTGRNHFLPSN